MATILNLNAPTLPVLRAPIVLVHGLMGFNQIQFWGHTVAEYFPGVTRLLREAGNRVFVPALNPTAGVAARAAQLKAFLDEVAPEEPVHLITHSMGGLDARYMLSRLGMGPRALSLTTLGTPHRGTAFADWGVRHLEWAVRPFLVSLGIPVQAFYDLTTTACAAFNRDVPDVPGVRYFSVAARHDGHFFQPEWLLPYRIVYDAEGANDGVVSVASATYGEGIEVWDGDHLCLANWIDPRLHWRGLRFDAEARFGSLIRRLADEGF